MVETITSGRLRWYPSWDQVSSSLAFPWPVPSTLPPSPQGSSSPLQPPGLKQVWSINFNCSVNLLSNQQFFIKYFEEMTEHCALLSHVYYTLRPVRRKSPFHRIKTIWPFIAQPVVGWSYLKVNLFGPHLSPASELHCLGLKDGPGGGGLIQLVFLGCHLGFQFTVSVWQSLVFGLDTLVILLLVFSVDYFALQNQGKRICTLSIWWIHSQQIYLLKLLKHENWTEKSNKNHLSNSKYSSNLEVHVCFPQLFNLMWRDRVRLGS